MIFFNMNYCSLVLTNRREVRIYTMNLTQFLKASEDFQARVKGYHISNQFNLMKDRMSNPANEPDPNQHYYDAISAATHEVSVNPADLDKLNQLVDSITALRDLQNSKLTYNPNMIDHINLWRTALTNYEHALQPMTSEVLMKEWSGYIINKLKEIYRDENWHNMIAASIETARTKLMAHDKPTFTFSAQALVTLNLSYEYLTLLEPHPEHGYQMSYSSLDSAQKKLAALLEKNFSLAQVNHFATTLHLTPAHAMRLRTRTVRDADLEEPTSAKHFRR